MFGEVGWLAISVLDMISGCSHTFSVGVWMYGTVNHIDIRPDRNWGEHFQCSWMSMGHYHLKRVWLHNQFSPNKILDTFLVATHLKNITVSQIWIISPGLFSGWTNKTIIWMKPPTQFSYTGKRTAGTSKLPIFKGIRKKNLPTVHRSPTPDLGGKPRRWGWHLLVLEIETFKVPKLSCPDAASCCCSATLAEGCSEVNWLPEKNGSSSWHEGTVVWIYI